MANTLLTVDQITKESLRVLHQEMTFIGRINRAYDSSFAVDGAKIGDTLRIRLPNQYVVRDGVPLVVQDVSESKVDLQVSTRKGVDMNFTSTDLTMDMEIFSQRIIQPAMSVLSSAIEADALQTMTKDVYQMIDNDTNAPTFLNFTDAGARLSDSLTPDGMRTALLSNTTQSKLVNTLKGLFQSSEQISSQYLKGVMGETAGFTFASSSHVSNHTTGTAVKGDTSYNVDGANQTGTSVTVDTGSTSLLAGDIITFAGTNSVHTETKVDSGILQQFVVTADTGTSFTSVSISPSIVTSGAKQNVSASPTTTGALSKIGAGNGELLTGNLCFHKDAFTFATADLIMDPSMAFASRQVFDGISMRIVRQYDINNDHIPTRLDVHYGFKTIRPELAVRVHADG